MGTGHLKVEDQGQILFSSSIKLFLTFQGVFSSWVQSLSHVWLFATPGTAACRLPCPSPTPRACSNSCPSSWWCYSTISSYVIPFSFCLQSFSASGSSLMSQLFASGGQSIGASASSSVLPMNIQDWFPLGCTGLISLQSKECSTSWILFTFSYRN